MRLIKVRPAFAAASVVAAAGILAAGLALRPAIAGVSPNASVVCTSSSFCQTYKNKGTNGALQGIATKGQAAGLSGINTNSAIGVGVTGSGGTSGNGVNGYGGNTGVSGTGGTWGVFGFTSASGGYGVEGQSDNGDGVDGFSVCCNGVDADSETGNGLVAIGGSGGVSIFAVGGTNDDIYASAGWGSGKVAVRGDNTGDNGSDGDAAEFNGSYLGVIARSTAGTSGFPFDATDQFGNNLVFINGNGDLFVHGSYNNFTKVRGGGVAVSYTSEAAAPTIEDNGTAQLINGTATVELDSAFARSIDTNRVYQVMLTPDGDTKGLYIASKTPTSFVVREVQGGRGTLAFDYHIYAPKLGQAGQRMSVLTAAQAQLVMPHAPIVPALHIARPAIKTFHPVH